MESGDIGSRGADRGSVLNGHCSEYNVTSIICRCSHYYTAPVRTFYKGRMPCGVTVDETLASYTMATLNTIYHTHMLSLLSSSLAVRATQATQ